MSINFPDIFGHPEGEQPAVEPWSATAETFSGRGQVEWDGSAPVTPLGQLPFFIEYLKQSGLFDGWVADCPLLFTSPNAPPKRDLLGTVMLSVLSGHYRYAHITTLRCGRSDLAGYEESDQRGCRAAAAWRRLTRRRGRAGLQTHLDDCIRPLLSEPWVLDVDSTVKPLYGHQEGAAFGYNPRKPGRPSHCYHTYLMSNLRLVLGVDVQPGNEHAPTHRITGLRSLLHRLGRHRWPTPSGDPAPAQAQSAAWAVNSPSGQPRLSFAEVGAGRVWEYAALVTSLDGQSSPWVSCTAIGRTVRSISHDDSRDSTVALTHTARTGFVTC
jgi:hypothetical protein